LSRAAACERATAERVFAIDRAVSVFLSARGMQRVPFDRHEADFEFAVGDRGVKVCSVMAEFISAKVCQMRRSDATYRR